jgi:pyocin large subunit-like protein
MISLRRLAAIFVPFAIAALGACDLDLGERARRDEPAGVATSARPDRASPRFAPGQLEQHFAKHGGEMGFATKEDYLRAAQALVSGAPGVETWRRGGDTLFFRESTSEFAVLSERGVIRTYFKPSDGRRYWARQKGR